MNIQDYPVSFPYGATSAPYTRTSPHRGSDRKAPSGTPVVVEGVRIGTVGTTGWSTGPHLHTQAGTDLGCQNTINPAPYEFKAGTVVNLGIGNQWGNFVTIKVGDKYVTYCHLSRIDVTKGMVIKPKGVNEVANAEQVKLIYQAVLRRAADAGGLTNYTGKDANLIVKEMMSSQERINLDAHINGLNKKVAEMQTLISSLSARPTKEEYARVQAQVADKIAEIQKTQLALEEAKKTGGFTETDRKTLNGISTVVNAVLAKITGIFK